VAASTSCENESSAHADEAIVQHIRTHAAELLPPITTDAAALASSTVSASAAGAIPAATQSHARKAALADEDRSAAEDEVSPAKKARKAAAADHGAAAAKGASASSTVTAAALQKLPTSRNLEEGTMESMETDSVVSTSVPGSFTALPLLVRNCDDCLGRTLLRFDLPFSLAAQLIVPPQFIAEHIRQVAAAAARRRAAAHGRCLPAGC